MNVSRNYIIGSIIAFLSAILLYALYNHWIIVRTPWHMNTLVNTSAIIQKKQIILHCFHGDKWKSERQDVLWYESTEKNIYHLMNALLILLDEEHITIKKTTLQSVLITSADTAYLSFDRSLFGKEETIYKKWMVIESILKTIKDNGIAIKDIHFLVHHEILQDNHLDFSLPWPVYGFMK